MSIPVLDANAWQTTLASSVDALRHMANYTLPSALDRRLLDLGERKETLTSDERDELLAWVEFTQDLSLKKL